MVVNVVSTYATVKLCTRKNIILWIKNLLRYNITKLEDLKSGVEFCQIMEILFPRTAQLDKLCTNPRLEGDYLQNWKVLQNTFEKLKITKTLSISQMVHGKYHEIFDFLQWFKLFFEANYDGHSFDPVQIRKSIAVRSAKERRRRMSLKKSKSTPVQMEEKTLTEQPELPSGPARPDEAVPCAAEKTNPQSRTTTATQSPSKKNPKVPKPQPRPSTKWPYPVDTNPVERQAIRFQPPKKIDCGSQTSNTEVRMKEEIGSGDEGKKIIEFLKKENRKLKEVNNAMAKEKVFFYEKMKGIEEICKENLEIPEVENIRDILFATENLFFKN